MRGLIGTGGTNASTVEQYARSTTTLVAIIPFFIVRDGNLCLISVRSNLSWREMSNFAYAWKTIFLFPEGFRLKVRSSVLGFKRIKRSKSAKFKRLLSAT